MSFKHRIAHGVWINDIRNKPFLNHNWPCVILDDQTVTDIIENMRVLAGNGFDYLTLFGLVTAQDWQSDFSKTIDGDRRKRINTILKAAKEIGITIVYGMGVYSWGFDHIIQENVGVRGTNPHAMCADKELSWKWMQRIIDFITYNFDINAFHLEAADLGRCECSACKPMSNCEYYCKVNSLVADYIKGKNSNSFILTNLCGYLSKGKTITKNDWQYLQGMSHYLDCLIDPGHFGTFIPESQRQEFIQKLHCDYGTSGGVWLYPPPRWDRLRYFIPYTQRSGAYIEQLYADGGLGIEYNNGPLVNPAVELNVMFGGKKVADVSRDNRDILCEVIVDMFQPKSANSRDTLAELFIRTENVFFESISSSDNPLMGEIHLTHLFGNESTSPTYLANDNFSDENDWYLAKPMLHDKLYEYNKNMLVIVDDFAKLKAEVKNKYLISNIGKCMQHILSDCQAALASPVF